MSERVVALHGITKSYRMGKDNIVHALRGADLEVERASSSRSRAPSGSGNRR